MIIARLALALAMRALGDHRRGWALAMEAEFEAAVDDGRPFGFALGCLIAAWRELPLHREGRFALANHVLVLGLVLPIAALLFSVALLGYPFVASGDGGPPSLLLNDGDIAAAPTLTMLVILLAVLHLLVAWRLLDRDWAHAAALIRLCAATTVTLVTFTAILALDIRCMLLPVASLLIQAVAVLALMRWHAGLERRTAPAMPI